jgi:hypothetical protein
MAVFGSEHPAEGFHNVGFLPHSVKRGGHDLLDAGVQIEFAVQNPPQHILFRKDPYRDFVIGYDNASDVLSTSNIVEDTGAAVRLVVMISLTLLDSMEKPP